MLARWRGGQESPSRPWEPVCDGRMTGEPGHLDLSVRKPGPSSHGQSAGAFPASNVNFPPDPADSV